MRDCHNPRLVMLLCGTADVFSKGISPALKSVTNNMEFTVDHEKVNPHPTWRLASSAAHGWDCVYLDCNLLKKGWWSAAVPAQMPHSYAGGLWVAESNPLCTHHFPPYPQHASPTMYTPPSRSRCCQTGMIRERSGSAVA